YFKLNGDAKNIYYIYKYLHFIKFCQQPGGNFLNYVDKTNQFTDQNNGTNLDDANGRAIWALGYVVSMKGLLPEEIIISAKTIMDQSLAHIETVHSTRAMAFVIKGIYNYQITVKSPANLVLLQT